jgi:hypothetical protein
MKPIAVSCVDLLIEAGFADPWILGTFISEAAFPYPVGQINPC